MPLEQQQASAEPLPSETLPAEPQAVTEAANNRRKAKPRPTCCLNCGAAATGKFCAECGQENEDQTVAMKLLVSDFLADLASFDSRLFRTLVPLIIRPGFLTNEYNAGRRVRYLSPFKLYLTLSVLFFLVLPFSRHASLVNFQSAAAVPAKAGRAVSSAKRDAAARIKADKDLQEAQTELNSDIQEDAPGLKVGLTHDQTPGHATLSFGKSSYDLTHLPATVEAYNAQQRDPGQPRDPKLVQYLKRQIIKVKQNPQSLSAALLDYIPKTMFLLLPAFALSLKIIYLRSERLYVEHLIFSLHLHAFLFLLLTLLLTLDAAGPRASAATPLAVIAALLYPFIAMRVVYQQSWGKTFVKYTLLAVNYFFLLTFTLLGALAIAFLLI